VGKGRFSAVTAPADAHEWVSFADPDEDRTWLFDVTFLSSSWQCIFGRGCQGVLTARAPALVQGCCSYGAHFSDDADIARVSGAVDGLTAEEWQFATEGRRDGFLAHDGDTTTTALVDDACIFLNRPGFPGGVGCAFHLAAARLGVAHKTLKPDVCWQLPLRREDTVDGTGHVTSKIHEWRRKDWGEAGEEFAWWCTESSAAFTGVAPVVASLADELRGLVGAKVYTRIRDYIDARAASPTPLPHPTVRKRRPSRSRTA
jgi:hypothetical protein